MKRFKIIPEFPDYIASYDGIIVRIKKIRGSSIGKVMKQRLMKDGYVTTRLAKNKKQYKRYVHVLVTSAFLGQRPKGKEVDHIDGNKQNNSIQNLRYLTPKGNIAHLISLNPNKKHHAKGRIPGNAKLISDQVKQVKKLLNQGTSTKHIASLFNVTQTCICEIKANRNWAWVK